MSDTPIQHHGDIVVLYCKAEHFQVEAHNIHGSNVTSFNMESGERRWFVVGCYFPPDSTSTIESVEFSTGQSPKGVALLVSRDFNYDLAVPEGKTQEEYIMAELASAGLDDMPENFLPCHKMGTGWKGLVHAPYGMGGAVLERLPSGDIPPSIPERPRLGPP